MAGNVGLCAACSLRNRHRDKQYVVYNDPIHGTIEVHPLLHKIINTPEFNRLKNIKQLSGKYYVYPGAMHTRFEHSIGVCYIAGEFVRMLCQKQTDLDKLVDFKDILCVEMAGLCHDLGHGPFSHLFEKSVMTKEQIEKWCTTPGEWEHEDLSKQILQRIFDRERSWFTESEIEQDQINMVKKMMHHNAKDIEKEPKRFLYEIVANDKTGLDVDKWDYFERDCHYTGLSNPFDWRRCMKLSYVIGGSICFRDKEVGNIYDMFRTRSYLHMHVYQHKTGDAVDHMIAEAIRYAGDSGAQLLYVEGKSMSVREVVSETRKGQLDGFVALTDSILQLITHANSGPDSKVEFGPSVPEDLTLEEKKELLQKAQELLKKLDRREIFRVICTESWTQFPQFAYDLIEKRLKKAAEDENIASTDLVVKKASIAYEGKGKDPVQDVKFYSKRDLEVSKTRDQAQIEPKVPELIIPRQFKEEQLRVYWLKREDTKDKESTIEAKVKEVLEKCKKKPTEITQRRHTI